MTPNVESKTIRPSAAFPFVLSVLSFALTIILVISGTSPASSPDSYIFRVNTTNGGTNLLILSPIVPTTATAAVSNITARNVITLPKRSIIADAAIQNSTESNTTLTALSEPASASVNGLSEAPATNVTIAETTSTTADPVASPSSAAPVLTIPAVTGPTDPSAVPITLIGGVFQLLLNTLTSAMPQTFQNIVQLALAAQKQSAGVKQIYSFHLTGICFGNTATAGSTNATSEGYALSGCISYAQTGDLLLNSTKDSTDYFLVATTNITIPLLSKIPSLGESGKSAMDSLGFFILLVFVITLIGNGVSIFLSIGAFVRPGVTWIPGIATLVTMLSAQILVPAAFISSSIGLGFASGVNNSTSISGLTANSGSKFIAFIWIAAIAAQATNIYWTNLWLVKYRTTSFKKRERTQAQMLAGYRAIGKEIISDFKVKKPDEHNDTEALMNSTMEVKHWDENQKTM